MEFFRSVTITERAYAGPDYTSGQTLSTTVGIEHEKDSRLLEPIGILTRLYCDSLLCFLVVYFPINFRVKWFMDLMDLLICDFVV